MFLKYLFIRSNNLFEIVEGDDYKLIRWFVIFLLALNLSIYNGVKLGDIGTAIIGGFFLVLIIYLAIVHLIPFLITKISGWSNGCSSKNDICNVLTISLVPIVPSMFFETYAEISGEFSKSSEFASFVLSCVSLKILILGTAKVNKFSIKDSAITLLTFWGLGLVLTIVFGPK